MSPHDDHRDQLLQDVLVGDRDENCPEVQKLLAECEDFRARLQEFRELAGELDEAVAIREEIVAKAQTDPEAPGSDQVADILRREAGLGGGAPPQQPWYYRGVPLLVGLAAIATLTIWVWKPFSETPLPRDPDVILGAAVAECLRPVGQVSSFAPFEWKLGNKTVEWVEVFVYPAGSSETPLARSGEISESRWEPEHAEISRWPQEIEWVVKAYDALGDYQGSSQRVSAQRRTP